MARSDYHGKKVDLSHGVCGHLSVVHINANTPHVIHAAGSKKKNWQGTVNGGVVKEIPFADYIQKMHFIGALVTRFEE